MKSSQTSEAIHSQQKPSKLESITLDFEYNRTLTEERSMVRRRTAE